MLNPWKRPVEIKVEWYEPGLLRVLWPEEITAEDVARFIERHDAMVEPVTRYVIYHESKGVPGLNAALRRQLTQWVERSGKMHAARCLGACFVAEAPIARAIVTGVWWMISTPYPHSVHDQRSDALRWAHARLAEAK